MILSEIDIKEAFFGLVSASEIRNLISGQVYRDRRPINSNVEDVVISVLTTGAGQIQPFIININVYVPDVKRGKEFIYDDPRCKFLMRKCLDVLEEGVTVHRLEESERKEFGLKYKLESQKLYEVNGADFHAINHKIRVDVCTE